MRAINRSFRKSESKIFLRGNLERANRVDPAREMSIRVQAVLKWFRLLGAPPVSRLRPSGESRVRFVLRRARLMRFELSS